jgi:ABC-2 type transport system ATP-binding protein
MKGEIMDAVKCVDVSKVFKRKKKITALNAVSFGIPQGEIFGVVGPNGSGKSTLVRILSTLLIPDQGSARVFGHDVVREYRKVRPLINRVSVDAAFFKGISAWENLRYAARLYGLGSKDARERAMEILKELGFDDKRFHEPLEDLSRGMQQKVAIARAFFTSPMLLLLDEPTTGLDPRSKLDVQGYIKNAMKKNGLTIVLTTHDMREAQNLCHRVAIIIKGRFIAVGEPAQLMEQFNKSNLEDVFLQATGMEWKEEEEDDT